MEQEREITRSIGRPPSRPRDLHKFVGKSLPRARSGTRVWFAHSDWSAAKSQAKIKVN
jgi:hypothetical protein